MKKSIIAAGAASVALAAMPIVGVFAVDDGSTSDTINATITSGCAVTDPTPEKTIAISVAPGNTAESTAAGSISIVCTGVNWSVSAVGDGAEDHENELTKSGTTPKYIETIGTAASGASSWGYKVAGITTVSGTPVTPESGTTDFHGVPAKGSPETIAQGTAAITATINTQYQVNVSLTQEAGTYSGKVTYTVSHT